MKTRIQLVFLILFSIGVSGLILRAQVPLEVGRRDWASALPDGEGKGLVLGTCTQCHSLSPIALQRKSAKAWEMIVRDMVSRGAQIQVPEFDPITSYLAQNFGPDSVPLTNVNLQTAAHSNASAHGALMTPEMLPEGAGKTILVSSCTSCHELSKTTDAHKSEAGWRGNVKDMIRLGANLNPDEEAVLVAYLAKHFGPQEAMAPATPARTEPQSLYDMGGMARRSSQNLGHLLPDDEGKGLVLATCFQCHASMSYFSGQRKTPQAWRRTVYDMVSRGAQVTPQEVEIIVNYLVKHMTGEKLTLQLSSR